MNQGKEQQAKLQSAETNRLRAQGDIPEKWFAIGSIVFAVVVLLFVRFVLPYCFR